MSLKYKKIEDVKVADKVKFLKVWECKDWYDDKIREVLDISDRRQGLIIVSTKKYGEKWNGDSKNSIIISFTNVRKLSIRESREIELKKLLD